MQTTFDQLADGQAFRFYGSGRTVFVRVSMWSVRVLGKDAIIPIGGEFGRPPRDIVIRESWADCVPLVPSA